MQEARARELLTIEWASHGRLMAHQLAPAAPAAHAKSRLPLRRAARRERGSERGAELGVSEWRLPSMTEIRSAAS